MVKTLLINRKTIVSIFAVMLLTYSIQGISYAQDPPDTIVEFSDLNLAKAVRSALGLGTTGGRIPLLKIPKAELTRLTYLEYNNNRYWDTPIEQKISNLRGLEHAMHLRELSLYGNNLSDLSPLAGLTQLVKLDISHNKIRDLTPLSGLTQLAKLDVWGSIGVDSIGNEIRDLTPLSGLTQLAELGLGRNKIIDLSPLAGLTQLVKLYVSYNFITDLSPLADLTELVVLDLGDNEIRDLTPLSGLTQLAELSLDNNEIIDLSPLTGLTHLVKLNLGGNEIRDLTSLSGLTELSELRLGGNEIRDLTPLSRLTQLRLLYLGGNEIRDLTPLSRLTQLIYLDLSNNSIENFTPLAEFNNLMSLYLFSYDISDLSSLPVLPDQTRIRISGYDDPLIPRDIALMSTSVGYTPITLDNSTRSLMGTPAKYILSYSWRGSSNGIAAYMLLAEMMGCGFADAEVESKRQVYVKTESLGRLTGFESTTVCGRESRSANGTSDARRITHLRFYDESSSPNVQEIIHNSYTHQYELAAPPIQENTPELPTKTSSSIIVALQPASVVSPVIGKQLTFTLHITGGKSMAGYQATVQFDETALRYVSSANGDYLPAGAFFVEPVVEGNHVKLNAASLAGESNGDGTLTMLTFEVIAVKTSTLTLSDVLLTNSAGKTSVPNLENTQITEPTGLKGDVNGDGTVNIADLVLVAGALGKTGQNAADVNGDNVINIADLVLVAGALGTSAAAPALHPHTLEMLTATEVKQWLSAAQQFDLTDVTAQRGILFLEQLLATLTPKETALLPNFPNPFNPETWIPYHLAKDAEVTLHIYAVNGTLVRTLTLGHQPAGLYQNHSRAAYWDGKNAFGESVASGVYFYTLTAGDFTATRRMLIQK